ncbi:related to RRP8 - nucleolar protein required for efficient processing of pre-rRNA at site A2 [Melanopsichium pennsylvanicum]|uniref:Ribosomal RNA-processing protein 8 n=2 Tax=Melanopsichium pennsylvanicum TaxID=63383 RepID=A0AAJ4XPF8_9BASI|nr:related to RRP8-nucleolar protein required for efficient processing of pre-rRNA at site A2 [Melanopsichium pennsylvanicum 4]SNX86375.1 related to RRP8 - nucleolar protein required for efficient processing of pre-rRNA at site A2 [Melanopsichium pennsylvanicum]
MSGLDLSQLQAEFELKRSALADSILSKLPGLSCPSTFTSSALSQSSNTITTNNRPRQANLGLGATPKNSTLDDHTSANGNTRTAADLRLKGALTSKRKRWQNDEPNLSQASDEQDDEVGRADAIISNKKKPKQVNGIGCGKNHKVDKEGANKDPFATRGIEKQKAAQNQPRIVVVDGQEVDLSKLSKTQRKKINKQLKVQHQQTPTAVDTNPSNSETVAKTTASDTPVPISRSNSTATQQAITPTSNLTPIKVTAFTPLQAQMLSKLSGSRFRTINEKLYTTASTEAVCMMDASPSMFDEYHAGFREQVKSWPKNPLDRIAEMLLVSSWCIHTASNNNNNSKAGGEGGKNKAKSQIGGGGGIGADVVSRFTKQKKARFTCGALVVDLGAGQGGLAKNLNPKGFKVLCYDLVTTQDGWVRKQDSAAINGLPLPGYFDHDDPLGLEHHLEQNKAEGVVDVAVFCLSLMGTNWVHMLLEAKRVLRIGGEMIIAEVSSRFERGFDDFVNLVKLIGFGLENKDMQNTHFVLFEFTKLDTNAHVASLQGLEKQLDLNAYNATLDGLAEKGKSLLKPCIYKRR